MMCGGDETGPVGPAEWRAIVRVLFVLAVAAAAFAPASGASDLWLPLAAEASDGVRVDLVRSGVDGVELEVAVPGISLAVVETEAGPFTRVAVPGFGRDGEVGAPELPVLRRFVEIPVGASVAVEAVRLDPVEVDLAGRGFAPRLHPAQLPVPKCDCEEAREWRFSHKPDAYRGVVGVAPASTSGPFTVRDHTLALLAVSPVRYDATRGRLEVASRVRVRLSFSGGDLDATRARKQRLASRQFDAVLDRATVNLNFGGRAAGWHYPADAPVELLVIAPNDATMLAALEPFVAWKTSCGFHVSLVTTTVTGTTTTAIKSYIQGLYNGANPPVYILMIGDSPTPLPTFTNSGGGSGGTDLPFVQMDADLYPDMIVARWPVDDAAELIAMRDKILTYQQPTAGNSAWLNRALFMEGDDYASQGVTTHADVIAQLMQPAPNSAECTRWPESANHSVADLIAYLNTGGGWAVYSAHSGPSGWSGPPPLSTGDFVGFGNTGMYPLGFGHSCSSNEWNAYGDVFGEDSVIHAQKGFVSYWGGSNSTYWDEDDWLERGFFDSMFDADMAGNSITLDRQYSQGAACYAGLTEVTLKGGDEQYYWHCYNLNGDPTLDPFTRAPVGLTVGVSPVVPPAASDDFTVTVSDPAPVAGALVGVSQDGALLGAGFTDATGTASFHVDAPQAGAAMLVRVTAHNHLPTDASVQVAAGSDGVVVLDRSLYRCDATVTVDVFDDDLGALSTVDVNLAAAPSGGSATVTLARQGGDVVRFRGTATLGAALAVAHGDTLTVTYHDQDTGSGSPADKHDQASLDCQGPVISNVAAVAEQDSLTVTFVTSEPGSSTLTYGIGLPPGTVVSDSGLGTDHSLTATGLESCRLYYFGVASADALGNVTVDTNGGLYYQAETAGWGVLLAETLDASPGWTVNNNGNAHGWAFGVPTGQGGSGYGGEPDPTAGHTGSSVYGVNLNGDYDDDLTDNQLQLQAPSVDCSEATSLVLSYWRWLGVENDSWDHARTQVSVDGGAWTTVWESAETMPGGSWVQEVVDIGALAAGHADVRVRWTLGSTDGSVVYCGWNLDDVRLEGAVPCTGVLFADGFENGTCGAWSVESP